MSLEPAPHGYPIKLVRDNTAKIINATEEPGELFYGSIALADGRTLDAELKKKLVEEVGEFLTADGDGLEELVDVLAAVHGLAYHSGSTIWKLLTRMEEDPRGLFTRGMMMYGRHPEYDK